MNYWERHIGDFAADTAHLSALQVGIYDLLLDRYYRNEAPIPDALAASWARSARADVEPVLSEFFVLEGAAWRHKRADEEIEKYRSKIAKKVAAGRASANTRSTGAQQVFNTPSTPEPVQPSSLQTPVLKQEQKQEQARTPLRGSRLPAAFPGQNEIEWAGLKHPAVDPIEEMAKFRDYWTAKAGADARKVDWPATWRNWIRNARASPGARAGPAPKGKRATWYEQSGQAIDHAKQSSDLVLDSDSGRRALPVPAGA